jgi:preprotein translocase subunit SecA
MAGRGVDIKLGGPDATEEQANTVRALGGLFVLGTERHEARRIDNQLRGRSGRQGDPGETQFYVSMDDSLMRVFGGDRVKNMMGKFGIPEDQPIEMKMLNNTLENAQTRIEGFHFDSRKQILAYDDVLNQQRIIVYARRHKLLLGDFDEVSVIIDELRTYEGVGEIIDAKEREFGQEIFRNLLRRLTLQMIDNLWVEHLEVMNYTRSSVNLRAYGQRDPLIEYRKEGIRLFKEMQQALISRIIEILPKVQPVVIEREEAEMKHQSEIAQNSAGAKEVKTAKENKPVRNTEH